jgi:ribosomal subunit interface protein
MKVDISLKYLEKSEFVQNILDKGINKIERRVQIFKKDDPIHVSIHVEKNPNKEQYYCRSHIYLPNKVLAAQENGEKLAIAVNKTFDALSKQLGRVKDKVEHLRRRPSRSPKKEEDIDE